MSEKVKKLEADLAQKTEDFEEMEGLYEYQKENNEELQKEKEDLEKKLEEKDKEA